MERVRGWKGMLRPPVPAPVLRVCSMWKAGLLARDEARLWQENPAQASVLVDGTRACFVCQQQAQAEDAGVGIGFVGSQAEAVSLCPCCTLASHQRCAEKLVDYAASHGLSLSPSVDMANAGLDCFDHEPFVFRDRSCLASKLTPSRLHALGA